MAGFKINRVTSDIKLALSEILREVKDPRVSKLLSIVKLDVSGDMSYATNLSSGTLRSLSRLPSSRRTYPEAPFKALTLSRVFSFPSIALTYTVA